ncbi:MAG TPA: MFS transporter [Mycobacteriales bacterium]|nr:MFS transporter [Mycobacteriales bacterium]
MSIDPASRSLSRHRDFRRLWAGDTISQFGSMVTLIALPLLAVKTLHATPFEVGLLTAFETLAFLLVGLPAGAWVDRLRRRDVLIVGDLLRALLLGSLPLAAWLDVLALPQVYLVALTAGICTVFFDVAYQSYLPHLVGREHLVEGNAKLQASQSVAQVAGPSVGGLLVQWLTAPYAILVDAVSYLWSAVCVSAIRSREPAPERAPGRHLLREVQEGLAFVVKHPLLRSIAACTGTSNLFSSVGMVALISLLAGSGQLNLSAGTIGLLFAVGSVGGLVGALVARRVASWLGQGPAIWISALITVPTAAIPIFVHRDWTLGLLAVGQLVSSIGVVVYNITQVSFRQGLCPERLLGRMNATIRFLVWGTMPLGGLLGGALSTWIGLRPTFAVAAVGALVAAMPVFFSPLRWMRELPQTYDSGPDGLAEPAAGLLTEAADPDGTDPARTDPARTSAGTDRG